MSKLRLYTAHVVTSLSRLFPATMSCLELNSEPQRLQHSPSLPNLRSVVSKILLICVLYLNLVISPSQYDTPNLQSLRPMHRSFNSTASSHVSSDFSILVSLSDTALPTTPIHQTHNPPECKPKPKSKNQSHLMTPPLTPSASLKSNSTGAGHGSHDAEANGAIDDDTTAIPPSRFLLVSSYEN